MEEYKTNKIQIKKASSTLTILLMLSLVAAMLVIPNANAQHDKNTSEMTISMSNAIVTGSSVTISGTVMDVSPAIVENENIKLRFPNGVPAVSDENIDQWMLYVYKQHARPMDVTGVEVKAYAQQGDRVIDMGTTVSDATGQYLINWIPPADATGEWDIYAYFSGSEGYYGSYAQTAVTISAAPSYSWQILGIIIAGTILLISATLIFRTRKTKK